MRDTDRLLAETHREGAFEKPRASLKQRQTAHLKI